MNKPETPPEFATREAWLAAPRIPGPICPPPKLDLSAPPRGTTGQLLPPPIPPITTAKPKYVTVTANSRSDVEAFVVSLRRAAKDSRDTGGLYSAFLSLEDGQSLQVQIQLPILGAK